MDSTGQVLVVLAINVLQAGTRMGWRSLLILLPRCGLQAACVYLRVQVHVRVHCMHYLCAVLLRVVFQWQWATETLSLCTCTHAHLPSNALKYLSRDSSFVKSI